MALRPQPSRGNVVEWTNAATRITGNPLYNNGLENRKET